MSLVSLGFSRTDLGWIAALLRSVAIASLASGCQPSGVDEQAAACARIEDRALAEQAGCPVGATTSSPNQWPDLPAMCTPVEQLACQNLREVVLGQAIYNEGVAWPRDLIRRGGSSINSTNGMGVSFAEVRSTGDHCNITFVSRGSQVNGNDWGANVTIGDPLTLNGILGAYRPPATSTDPFDLFWLANSSNVGLHYGHYAAARALASDPIMATLAAEIAACQPGPANVHVTGHSLGAGITAYLYPYLASRYPQARFTGSASGPPRAFNPGLFVTLPIAAPAGWPTTILGPFPPGATFFVSNAQIAQLHALSPAPAAVLAALGGPPAGGVPYTVPTLPYTLHIGAQDPLASGFGGGLLAAGGLPPGVLGWIHAPGTIVNTTASHTEDRCATIGGWAGLACTWQSGYVYSNYEACSAAIRSCAARTGNGGPRVTSRVLGQVYRYLPGGSRTTPMAPVTVNACQPEAQIGVDCWTTVGARSSGYRRIYDTRPWTCREVLTETSTNRGIGPGWGIAVDSCSRMLQDCGEMTRRAAAGCPGGAPAAGAPQQVAVAIARAVESIRPEVPDAANPCEGGCSLAHDVAVGEAGCVEVGRDIAPGVTCAAPNEGALVECPVGSGRDLDNACIPAGESCPLMGGVSSGGHCYFADEVPLEDDAPLASENI